VIKSFFKSLGLFSLLTLAACLTLSIYSQDVNPIENNWLPFFGLIFPYALWLNIIPLAFLIIRKKVTLIVPLVAIVYAWPSIWNYYSLFPKTDFSQADIEEIELISYNVRIFDANENLGGSVRDSIFSALQRESPNIICFQEFYYVETPDEFDTKSIIQKELGLEHTSENFTHHMRGGKHSGVATFTSFPIVAEGVINFESDINNTCLYTDIIIGGDTVRVYIECLSLCAQHTKSVHCNYRKCWTTSTIVHIQ